MQNTVSVPAPSRRAIAIAQISTYKHVICARTYARAAATMGRKLCPDTVELLKSLDGCKLENCLPEICEWLKALAGAICEETPALPAE